MAKNPSRILVVAAHPDDEILGCGAAMATHAQAGDAVQVVIVAEGATSRDTSTQADWQDALSRLKTCANTAATVVGARKVTFLGFPDNRLDSMDRLTVVQAIEKEMATFQPDTVYTHWAGDVNVDHRRVHEAVVTACRPQPGHCVSTLLFFEVPSSTEWQPPGSAPVFAPNWFVPASETALQLKIEALKAYEPEMRPWPHPRSYQAVEHLSRWRGATIGAPAAEAFVLGRKINR